MEHRGLVAGVWARREGRRRPLPAALFMPPFSCHPLHPPAVTKFREPDQPQITSMPEQFKVGSRAFILVHAPFASRHGSKLLRVLNTIGVPNRISATPPSAEARPHTTICRPTGVCCQRHGFLVDIVHVPCCLKCPPFSHSPACNPFLSPPQTSACHGRRKCSLTTPSGSTWALATLPCVPTAPLRVPSMGPWTRLGAPRQQHEWAAPVASARSASHPPSPLSRVPRSTTTAWQRTPLRRCKRQRASTHPSLYVEFVKRAKPAGDVVASRSLYFAHRRLWRAFAAHTGTSRCTKSTGTCTPTSRRLPSPSMIAAMPRSRRLRFTRCMCSAWGSVAGCAKRVPHAFHRAQAGMTFVNGTSVGGSADDPWPTVRPSLLLPPSCTASQAHATSRLPPPTYTPEPAHVTGRAAVYAARLLRCCLADG